MYTSRRSAKNPKNEITQNGAKKHEYPINEIAKIFELFDFSFGNRATIFLCVLRLWWFQTRVKRKVCIVKVLKIGTFLVVRRALLIDRSRKFWNQCLRNKINIKMGTKKDPGSMNPELIPICHSRSDVPTPVRIERTKMKIQE